MPTEGLNHKVRQMCDMVEDEKLEYVILDCDKYDSDKMIIIPCDSD